jgi:hypothetical protein
VADLDFESFWADLRARRKPASGETIQIISDRSSNIEGMLNVACEKAAFDLAKKYEPYRGKAMTTDMLADVVSAGVRVFMEKWHEGLRGHNLAGLIEIVLEGQSLTPDEMVGFVRALPRSLLERISSSALGSATGIHGLMAVEFARRQGEVREYILRPDSGRVLVEFVNRDNQEVAFYLDETFKLTEPTAPPAVLSEDTVVHPPEEL